MRTAESYRSAKKSVTKARRRKPAPSQAASEPHTAIPNAWEPGALALSPGALASISAQTKLATAEAKKITVQDVDEAMERALTKHQASGASYPLPLNRAFSIRARLMGWIENVEFMEAGELDG